MNAKQKVILYAEAELGYIEKATNKDLYDKAANAGKANFTKYAHELDKLGVFNTPKNGYAWCAVFVVWLFVEAFGLDVALSILYQTKGGYGAGCTWTANRYKSMHRFFTNPQVGDQIFFTKDGSTSNHTGLVVKVEDGKVFTIEGNTSPGGGVVDNGGMVCAKSYPLAISSILGYGRPNWGAAPDDSVRPEKVVEWASEAWEAAKAKGVTDGTRPTDPITRQEVVAMLHRLGLF